MMKTACNRRILSLLLALTLTLLLGLVPITAAAEEPDSPEGTPQGDHVLPTSGGAYSTQLPDPQNLRIEDRGSDEHLCFIWEYPGEAYLNHLILYKDGAKVYETTFRVSGSWEAGDDCYVGEWALLQKLGSGDYHFTLQHKGSGGMTDSEVVESNTYTYTKPSTQVNAPTNLRWEEEGGQLWMAWDAPDNFSSIAYMVRIYRDGTHIVGGDESETGEYANGTMGDATRALFADVYNREELLAGNYTFTVQARTRAINDATDSPISQHSPARYIQGEDGPGPGQPGLYQTPNVKFDVADGKNATVTLSGFQTPDFVQIYQEHTADDALEYAWEVRFADSQKNLYSVGSQVRVNPAARPENPPINQSFEVLQASLFQYRYAGDYGYWELISDSADYVSHAASSATWEITIPGGESIDLTHVAYLGHYVVWDSELVSTKSYSVTTAGTTHLGDVPLEEYLQNSGSGNGGNTGGSSGRRSGGGSTSLSGGAAVSTATWPTATTTASGATAQRSGNVGEDGAVNPSAIKSQLDTALAKATGSTATVQTRNAQTISPAALKSLADAAAAAGKTAILHADTMSADNKAVQGRLYVEPARLGALSGELKLGVYTQDSKTAAVKAHFETHFSNPIAVVALQQQGALGARLQVAARVDLSGLDPATLVLYSYDKAANLYTPIPNADYYVDSNNYLHFYTQQGGSIIISGGELRPR